MNVLELIKFLIVFILSVIIMVLENNNWTGVTVATCVLFAVFIIIEIIEES